MKKVFCSLFLTLLFTSISCAQTATKPPESKLKIGESAPEFVLNDTDGNTVKLSDFQRQKVGRAGVLRARVYGRLNEGTSGISG